MTAVWFAVNRLALDGKTFIGPGERIGMDQTVRAFTIDVAYIICKTSEFCSLEPGKLANFSTLEAD
jgi:predicted amidohydrolase YtcJ